MFFIVVIFANGDHRRHETADFTVATTFFECYNSDAKVAYVQMGPLFGEATHVGGRFVKTDRESALHIVDNATEVRNARPDNPVLFIAEDEYNMRVGGAPRFFVWCAVSSDHHSDEMVSGPFTSIELAKDWIEWNASRDQGEAPMMQT